MGEIILPTREEEYQAAKQEAEAEYHATKTRIMREYDRQVDACYGQSWAEILEPHGWQRLPDSPAGEERWRAPNEKGPGWTASGTCDEEGNFKLHALEGSAAPLASTKVIPKTGSKSGRHLITPRLTFRIARASLSI